MQYKISFEVPSGRRVSPKQVPVYVWATLTGWGMETQAEFSRIQVITQNVEEQILDMPSQSGSPQVTAWTEVVVVLQPKTDQEGKPIMDARVLGDTLEKLAQQLGLEFKIERAPSVGLDDRKI